MRQFSECVPCGMRAEKPRPNWAFWPYAAWREYLSSQLWANRRGPLLIWACELLRKLLPHTLPPTKYSLLPHRAAAKIGCGTRVHTAFWAWRLHFMKKFIKDVKKSLDRAFFQFLKFKIIFTDNKVTALSKSVKSGKWQKTYFLRRVITWSKIVRF